LHAHPSFRVAAAFDGEHGKPSSGNGRSGCNETFRLNLAVAPIASDLAWVDHSLIDTVRRDFLDGLDLDVLSACPP
jgi:DNA (cytosine-5)-methyltransferase 1